LIFTRNYQKMIKNGEIIYKSQNPRLVFY